MRVCPKPTQTGFTLVELAISLTVIGLLLGGILKGQELLDSVRMNRTMKQVQNYEAGMTTFKDSYGQLPGDISNPSDRLPNCSASPCNTAGNEDGYIGGVISVLGGTTGALANTAENRTMWLHLAVAGLAPGVDPTGADVTWGGAMPSSFYTGGYSVAAFGIAGNSVYNGNVMTVGDTNSGAPLGNAPANIAVMPTRAVAQMDRKYDDGNGATGQILGSGNVTAGAYSETSRNNLTIPFWKLAL